MAAAVFAMALHGTAIGQGPPSGPPAVGVTKAEKRPMTETTEFIGRIEAINKVDIVARVTAYLEKLDFEDGAEVKQGDLLYELERPPFEADLNAKTAVADQYAAQLVNAKLARERATSLLKSNAGAQATVDSTTASEKALAAQLLGARASAQQSQINLDYTRIASPISGKVGRTKITRGNVVSPVVRDAGHDRQPESDVRDLPGGGPHTPATARQIRAQRRVRRGQAQGPVA